MSPTPRAAVLLAIATTSVIFLPVGASLLLIVVTLTAAFTDAWSVRGPIEWDRTLPPIAARGVPVALNVEATKKFVGSVRLRQPSVPDLSISPSEHADSLDSSVVAKRRGRHVLAPIAYRRVGPLGLGCWHGNEDASTEIHVYPDYPAAYRILRAVRASRFRTGGQIVLGPLGLGTEFDRIREYQPDDEIRQVNWPATARLGRPMSNQHRVEQDRDIMFLIDCGRLMSAPLGDRTRLDAALDAAIAVAFVAGEVGDRVGMVAFDEEVRRAIKPQRNMGQQILRSVYDLEPKSVDSDYELAFRVAAQAKRSLVMIFTDILDEGAARSMVAAVPVLSRRHHVVVVSSVDPDLEATLSELPESASGTYELAVALDVAAARTRASATLKRAGADIVEAPAETLARSCVDAYLRAKAKARL